MAYTTRKKYYRQIENDRDTKVLAFVTGDRQGLEIQIAQDCINFFIKLLDAIGPTKRISLILHTNGGDTLAAWRLVNLLHTFCDELEVIIPNKALSSGTLISIGANNLVMTKQAALGPIDPSVQNPLNPRANINGQERQIPVSVESIRGYLDAAKDQLGIKSETELSKILISLSQQVHPLVLGNIFRSTEQIRFLAGKLLEKQVKDKEKSKSIINFLCADSGSHDYTINRREAEQLGLVVEKPSQDLYKIISRIHDNYTNDLKLLEPYSVEKVLGNSPVGQKVTYTEYRGLIEGTNGGCYGFVSEGEVERVQVQTPVGLQNGVNDVRSFEGWRKI